MMELAGRLIAIDWNAKLYNYCERGQDPSLWAEPLNAVTNLSFVAAAMLAAYHLMSRRKASQASHLKALEPGNSARNGPGNNSLWTTDQLYTAALITLVAIIGIGSFLFHTFATHWAAMGDVAPIGVFMLTYMGFALRSLLGLSTIVSVLGVLAFAGAIALSGTVSCGDGPCLNGSIGYLPALFGIWGIGAILWRRGNPAAALLLGGGAVLALSLTFRSIDFYACAATSIMGYTFGTHFLWHILNAMLLYLLLRAAIDRTTQSPN